MATFSTNQARQVYVAKVAKDASAALTNKGDIAFVAPKSSDSVYFKYVGADTPLRSDLISKDLIMKASLTHGDNLAKYLHQYEVAFDPDVSADPIAGQQYLLRINMLGYASLGMDQTYQKYGYVKATAGMTVSDFYKKLAKSLAQNFSREPIPIYRFYVSTSALGTFDKFPSEGTPPAGVTEITASTNLEADDIKAITAAKKLVIVEASGVWKRGTDEDMPQMAQIFTDLILVNGIEANWGKVEEVQNTISASGTFTGVLLKRRDTVFNQLADMEYFYLGERGDVYRSVGWPYVIGSSYLMDDLKGTTEFGIIDIHYSYVGSNESVQKSEKDCTIIAPYAEAEKLAKKIVGAGIKVMSVKKDHTVAELTAA